MQWSPKNILTLLTTQQLLSNDATTSLSFTAPIVPGMSFISQAPPARATSAAVGEEVVIFEHSDYGTGGLVINRPTPIMLRDLSIPRFDVFKSNVLMLGCGIDAAGDDGMNTIAMGEMSPWYWLHDVDDIPGSYLLEGAEDPLYMGGNLEEAVRVIRSRDGDNDPACHFKFFWKHKVWGPGELAVQVEQGLWNVQSLNSQQALRPYKMIGLPDI